MPKINHCWAGKFETLSAGLKYASPEWVDVWLETHDESGADPPRKLDGTCLLEAGHTGPHEWTPDGAIQIEFAEIVLH